jgi:uncharacterized protein
MLGRPHATDGATWDQGKVPRRRVRSDRRSLHLTMRDGVKIAVDVHLPADRSSERLPVILRQTRYFRGVALRPPFAQLGIDWLLDHAADTRARFLAAGYAWVDVCARGSGASFGRRPCPWSPDEIADGGEIVDWIVDQPWSNGRVGATGVSYDGTTSELLLVTQHPAVRAVCPRFSLYDVYTDVAFPGGIHLRWFTEAWGAFNKALDAGTLDHAFAMMLRVQVRALRALPSPRLEPLLQLADSEVAEKLYGAVVRVLADGVRPVDDDAGGLLRAAVDEHRENFDVHEGALAVSCRDDAGIAADYPEATIDFFSPHAHADALRATGVPILGYSGWLDAAYQHGAIKRFRAIDNAGSGLIIGPWDHGGMGNVSPFSDSAKAAFDQDAELIRFFDRHLRGVDHDDPAVRYFTMGAERWQSAATWPPPGFEPRRWHLDKGQRLSDAPGQAPSADAYRIDTSIGTGRRSRWDSLLGLLPPVGYSHRRALGGRSLVYRSEPLEEAVEVTGHAQVVLTMSSDGRDPYVFVYLEDEAPDGTVRYVTEGQLRAAHRVSETPGAYPASGPSRSFRRADLQLLTPHEPVQIAFDLLPTSWQVGRGHRLRLVITGSDRDHFADSSDATELTIHLGGHHVSHLELPIRPVIT